MFLRNSQCLSHFANLVLLALSNLERLGSTIVSTKTHPIRVRKGDGVSRQLDKLRYDWLGNAVSVDVAEYVARSILQDKSAPNTA